MQIQIQDTVHYPLGAASYIFKDNLIEYILKHNQKEKIVISIGAQPNSSPHLGTICVLSLAFSLGKKIKEINPSIEVSVLFELIDTAPVETLYIDNIKYQRNLCGTTVMRESLDDFLDILNHYSKSMEIPFTVRPQASFNSQPEVSEVVRKIVDMRDVVAPRLDPSHGRLRIRASCPSCGLVDKECVTNGFFSNQQLVCHCPRHGAFSIDLTSETHLLSYNTPLRNLIRAIIYSKSNADPTCEYQIMRITGNEYAGFYQEELLYKAAAALGYPLDNFPIILYCPTITDWSGAKLSKSLYVEKNAYFDLPLFLQNYSTHKQTYGYDVIDFISSITDEWVNHPYMLFRDYSIFYFEKRFRNER